MINSLIISFNPVAIHLTIKTVSKLSVVVGFRTELGMVVGSGKPGGPEQDWTVKARSWMGSLKSDSIVR